MPLKSANTQTSGFTVSHPTHPPRSPRYCTDQLHLSPSQQVALLLRSWQERQTDWAGTWFSLVITGNGTVLQTHVNGFCLCTCKPQEHLTVPFFFLSLNSWLICKYKDRKLCYPKVGMHVSYLSLALSFKKKKVIKVLPMTKSTVKAPLRWVIGRRMEEKLQRKIGCWQVVDLFS